MLIAFVVLVIKWPLVPREAGHPPSLGFDHSAGRAAKGVSERK